MENIRTASVIKEEIQLNKNARLGIGHRLAQAIVSLRMEEERVRDYSSQSLALFSKMAKLQTELHILKDKENKNV